MAAEITAALLLIAFAIPDRKKPAVAPSSTDDSESQRRLATARRAHCQATMYRGIAALANRCTDDPAAGRFELYAPLSLLGWEDRLTKLGNRAFLDAFLEEWLSLPESTRQGALLTMIVVDKYSDMLREQGAMGVEQSLRDLGERIAKHYETTAIVGRYQPDRFLVVQFERSLAESHQDFESLNNSASNAAEASPNSPPGIPCVASIVELGEEGLSLSKSLDKLDEGVAQAVEMGASCVSESEGVWTNKRVVVDHDSSSLGEQVRDGASEENDAPKERRRLTPEPTDVSAVASSEDIAALFQQISQKKQESSSVEPPQEGIPGTPEPVAPIDDDNIVGADDIAALFAANASTRNPEPKAATTAPPKIEAQSDSKLNELLNNLHNEVAEEDLDSPGAPKPVAPIGDDTIVGADDIAALFAANASARNPETKAAPPTPPKIEAQLDSKLNELLNNLHNEVAKEDLDSPGAPKPVAPIGDDTIVGADDIAALFAANASARNPETKAATTAPPKIEAQSDSKLNELLNNLHNEVAGEDLDSLFAKVR